MPNSINMASQNQVVHTSGIFHGLPTYSELPEMTDLTAVVTGSNGISGQHLIKVLLEAPRRWKTIYCLSRRPPSEHLLKSVGNVAGRVQHIPIDFLKSGEEIGKVLNEYQVQADHVFFFSYMQPPQKGALGTMWGDADALAEINTKLLVNFLNGLDVANVRPKVFLLQTGGKHYGIHLGPVLTPTFETDPRPTLENNFYYHQQDRLAEWCLKKGVQWNVARPSIIDGAVRESSLNYLVGIAVYAAVQAHLGLPLYFPATIHEWGRERSHSSAKLNAYFEEWLVLNSQAGNQAFNIVDGSAFTWGRLWIYLAEWYGTTWVPPEEDESKYRTSYARHETPPQGFGRGITRTTFTLLEWSHKPEVVEAWAELSRRFKLTIDPFKDRGGVFGLADVSVICGWPFTQSMGKARKFGWLGTVDTYESIFNSLKKLGEIGVSVPLTAKEFRPWWR